MQAEEVACLNALERVRRAKKKNKIPGVMRGDDRIGIVIDLQHRNQQANIDHSVVLLEDSRKCKDILKTAPRYNRKTKGV